jgi:hypothetical protein
LLSVGKPQKAQKILMKYPTVYSLFKDRIQKYAAENVDANDVFYFRSGDRWQGISWRRFEEGTLDFATALLSPSAVAPGQSQKTTIHRLTRRYRARFCLFLD